MILADTSIWIGHLRKADPVLIELLEAGEVLAHPMVIGELACGTMPRRDEVLGALLELPAASVATDPEVLRFIDRHRLMGRGIGYVDVHLLAATLLSTDTRLWTADARLAAVAARLFVSFTPGR